MYEGVELEDYVFCGPSMVFTNDLTPRSRYPKGRKGYRKTLIKHDASIGANATIVCGNILHNNARHCEKCGRRYCIKENQMFRIDTNEVGSEVIKNSSVR